MTRMTAIVAIAIATVPVAANAKEAMIRCLMNDTQTTAANPHLQKRMQEQEKRTAIRHYILDDANKAAWIVIDGERRALCDGLQNCSFTITATAITRRERSPVSASNMIIDRLAGTISEDWSLLNNAGETVIRSEFGGVCEPEAIEKRKF